MGQTYSAQLIADGEWEFRLDRSSLRWGRESCSEVLALGRPTVVVWGGTL